MGEYLVHFGIKGQKWGNRRYQNPDGTLTPEGIIRYRKELKRSMRRANSDVNRHATSRYVNSYNKVADYMNRKGISDYNKEWDSKHYDIPKHKRYRMSGYAEGYNERVNRAVSNAYAMDTMKELTSNKSYKEGFKYAKALYRSGVMDELVVNTIESDENYKKDVVDSGRDYVDLMMNGWDKE